MRNILFGILIAGGCASSSSRSISIGKESEAAVKQALEAPQQGEAALATGRATYWVPARILTPEREALVVALRKTPYFSGHATDHDAEIPKEVDVVFAKDTRVIAWLRSEVFEAACPTGTLRVERLDIGNEGPRYRVSVVKGSHVLFGGTKRGKQIDRAWQVLLQAAEKHSALQVDGGPAGHERPLEAMRDIGIDFGGVER